LQYFHLGKVFFREILLVCCQFISTRVSRVAQSCYSVIGDKPFLWSKPKFDPP